MILATLRTRILEQHGNGPHQGEGGFYEVDVNIDEAALQKSGDVNAYANTQISAYLATAVEFTTVPADLWTVEFSERAQRRYNFPAFLNLGQGVHP